MMPGAHLGLKEKLSKGERILVAEGYLLEFERRGYLKAGPFVPEVVLEHPELVKQLHEEFVHAGSDVVEAFTYYAHKQRLALVGREGEFEALNKEALKIARAVARETGALMAGNICNSTVYDPENSAVIAELTEMYTESVKMAVNEGADFIIGETFTDLGEAKIAVDCIKAAAPKLPFVITFTPMSVDGKTRDGYTLAEACFAMEKSGAAATGLNCSTGPATILPMMKEIRRMCKGPLACLPVPFNTKPEAPLMQQLSLPNGQFAFPNDLDCFASTTAQIKAFAKGCEEMGIQYVGLCCGNNSRSFRTLAESFGRTPKASKYSADPSIQLFPSPLRPKVGNVHVGM